MAIRALVLTVAGFVSGALMLSAWLVRLRGLDIRRFGDGNPGAVNAFKAAGPALGVAALLLDFLKAALPVWLAKYVVGVSGFWLVPVAVAPVLGHAFSPFVRGRGGKAIMAFFGAWCGLTLWEGPTVFGVLLGIAGLLMRTDAWRVAAALGLLGFYLVLRGFAPELLLAWAATSAVLLFKHRRALAGPVRWRWQEEAAARG